MSNLITSPAFKIDRCDRIGLREARNKAKALMSQIQSGIDPTATPDESGITLATAMDAHLKEKPLRSRTREGYEYHLEKYLKRFKNRAVADIGRQEVRDLYERLQSKSGQTTAGSVMRTLRAVINTAMRMDDWLAGPLELTDERDMLRSEYDAYLKRNRIYSVKATHKSLAAAGKSLGLEAVKLKSNSVRGWTLPPLDEARALFENRIGASGLFD